MFVSPPNSHVEVLIPKVMVLRDGACGRLCDHESKALGIGVGAVESNEQNRNRGVNTWDRLTAVRGEERWGTG